MLRLCSTPEGIEAAITRRTMPCGRWSRSAQRPKASKRRSQARHTAGSTAALTRKCSTPEGIEAAITIGRSIQDSRDDMCSTPEGIEAAITGRPCRAAPSRPPGAQRPKASKRRSRHGDCHAQRATGVLNARRHRSGDHTFRTHVASNDFLCSTPEGIEAAITRGVRRGGCTRPGAQRPKASKRRSRNLPGGNVPGGYSAQRPKASKRRSPRGRGVLLRPRRVLNARRHRSGDHVVVAVARDSARGCSTPEGIEAAITVRCRGR